MLKLSAYFFCFSKFVDCSGAQEVELGLSRKKYIYQCIKNEYDGPTGRPRSVAFAHLPFSFQSLDLSLLHRTAFSK